MEGTRMEGTRMKKNMAFWALQRISAIALIVLLSLHLWIEHFAAPHSTVTLSVVHSRLDTFRFLLLDYGLLVLALFHGLNGVRNIALDYTRLAEHSKGITWTLAIIGVAFTVYGGVALWYASRFIPV